MAIISAREMRERAAKMGAAEIEPLLQESLRLIESKLQAADPNLGKVEVVLPLSPENEPKAKQLAEAIKAELNGLGYRAVVSNQPSQLVFILKWTEGER